MSLPFSAFLSNRVVSPLTNTTSNRIPLYALGSNEPVAWINSPYTVTTTTTCANMNDAFIFTPMQAPNPISDITGKIIHCHQCGKQVHNPNNPRDSLPKEEYQKYLEYLDRLKLEPELLCCNCYNKLFNSSRCMFVMGVSRDLIIESHTPTTRIS